MACTLSTRRPATRGAAENSREFVARAVSRQNAQQTHAQKKTRTPQISLFVRLEKGSLQKGPLSSWVHTEGVMRRVLRRFFKGSASLKAACKGLNRGRGS